MLFFNITFAKFVDYCQYMKTKSCLLVDDSEEVILLTKTFFQKLPFIEVHSCSTCAEAIRILAIHHIDLIVLDIHLGAESGLDLLKLYPRLPPVIILSSHPEYAIDTYDIESVVDFVLKPLKEERFMRAISRALDVKYSDSGIVDRDFAFFKVSRKIVRFDFDNIDYIEAYGVYSKLYEGKRMTLVNESISALEQILPFKNFRRVHKSFIVNIQKITGIDHKYFLIDKEQIPIGVSYKSQLTGLFKLFNHAEPDDWQ